MSCFFQIIFAIVFVFSASLAAAIYATDTNKAAIPAAISLLSFFVIVALRRKGKKARPKRSARSATPAKMPKYMAAILAHAHRALQRETFYCRQCGKKKPIAEAALVEVEHDEEFINNDDEDDLRTRKTHDYRGLICARCARIVANLSNDEYSYYTIPDELRAGND